MGKYHYILFSFLLLIVTVSCVDIENELDEGKYEPQIVIEGSVIDSYGRSFVKVSFSSSYSDSITPDFINDAIVNIIEDDSISYILSPASNGLYTNASLLGKTNSTYTLIVNYKEIEYKAVSKLLPISKIDSLVFKNINDDQEETAEYEISVFAKRVSEEYDSFYRVVIYKNGVVQNSYSDLLLMTDAYLKSFNNLVLPDTYASGDTIRIEVHSISEQVFNYYFEINQFVSSNLNTVYDYPENPNTNISNGALGIFQTSAVSSTEIVLP